MLITGCSTIEKEINEYSKDKEKCELNQNDITHFTCKNNEYVILDDTVTNEELGNWIGYFRCYAIVDSEGKLIMKQDMDSSIKDLVDSKKNSPSAEYMIPYLNVYEYSSDTDSLVVDVNGSYHLAIRTIAYVNNQMVFNFKTPDQSVSNEFIINEDNVTQLINGSRVYQITDEIVDESRLGKYMNIIAENITFDTDTNKALSRKELLKIDVFGTHHQNRESWMYGEIHAIEGTDVNEAVAVEINNEYRMAEAK